MLARRKDSSGGSSKKKGTMSSKKDDKKVDLKCIHVGPTRSVQVRRARCVRIVHAVVDASAHAAHAQVVDVPDSEGSEDCRDILRLTLGGEVFTVRCEAGRESKARLVHGLRAAAAEARQAAPSTPTPSPAAEERAD